MTDYDDVFDTMHRQELGSALPTFANWTKSLRDSLELTELVMLRGMR
jgi:hypothetical protein